MNNEEIDSVGYRTNGWESPVGKRRGYVIFINLIHLHIFNYGIRATWQNLRGIWSLIRFKIPGECRLIEMMLKASEQERQKGVNKYNLSKVQDLFNELIL